MSTKQYRPRLTRDDLTLLETGLNRLAYDAMYNRDQPRLDEIEALSEKVNAMLGRTGLKIQLPNG